MNKVQGKTTMFLRNKRIRMLAFIVLLTICSLYRQNVFAQAAERISDSLSVDAVSSATGSVFEGIEFYQKYGIIAVSFPYTEGTHWKMRVDPSSEGAVRVMKSGAVNGRWYAGIEADSDNGQVRVTFRLMQGKKSIREICAEIQIENGKIAAVGVMEEPEIQNRQEKGLDCSGILRKH